ncbi:hypothetical protein scyTo_0002067 [Scyliorhinus torazame]|uniref:Hepatocyte growth factor n=1 Tax=Scyliorhinus torazame TaxID=75743 RepID=A0A401PHG3_SCYTO|nr:hypothetical protein [Scyliorhinus torazame]
MFVFLIRFLPSSNRNKNLQENYCRNPRGEEGGPWCFTMNRRTRLESCAVPQCSEVECMTCNGETYRGPMDHTESGKECQRWDLQMPHNHRFNPERFPDKGLDDNYCRNPNGRTKPWCYTLDPHIVWEYCAIKECVHNCDHDSEMTTECFKDLGESYRGTMNTTPSGIPCQRWDLQFPHHHNFTPENYKCKRKHQFFQQPSELNMSISPVRKKISLFSQLEPYDINGEGGAQSAELMRYFFRANDVVGFEKQKCYQGIGTTYRGTVSKTRTGVQCAPWINYNQASERTASYTNSDSLVENYCRNPDADKHGPWCYTNDPFTPWDYCAIESCDKTPKLTLTGTHKCSNKLQTRIINGFRAKAKSSSWMVSLRHRDNHFCGGSLIENNWVLTAKHCFSTCKQDLRGYEAVMGIIKDDRNEAAHKQVMEISLLVCGPEGSNLVMLKLARPVKSTDYVHWIKLPRSGCVIREGVSCNISGWGETKGTGYEGELKVAQIPIVGNKKCSEYHQGKIQIRGSEICAGDEEGTVGTCERDYGGPLVCEEDDQKLLQGVIIPGRGCAKPKRPGIFVRVSYYVTWIDKVCQTYRKNNHTR